MSVNSLRTGQLVRCPDLALGVAKIESIDGDEVLISFFESVARRHQHQVRRDQVVPHTVYPQNRCYVRGDDERWRVGRLVDLPTPGQRWYGVQFPNDRFEEVPEENVYIRWSAPVRNPVEVLELHGHETPFWYERRWPMVEALTAQRAAARGMNALLSSAVELREHQVDVALRILQDPVQRYLLADEVGLGKTVEAGLVIRQRLLDDPRSRVVVLVPDSLVIQWTNELHNRFFLSDFPDADVRILGQGQRELPDAADLLVVDEAHHLAAHAYGDAGERRRYAQLEKLACASPRLLLLSATPAASDQRGFLAMLHLLEPDVYRLDDLAGFERRVTERESIGALFYSLDEETPSFLLEDSVTEIREHFPDDAHLMQLCTDLIEALDDDVRRVQVIRAIRVHVSETYRLHRRMLRHRRAGRAGDVVRGRVDGGALPWVSAGMQGTWAALEEWRDTLALAVEEGHCALPEALEAVSMVYEASQSAMTLKPVLSDRLGGEKSTRKGTARMLFPGEEGPLRAALRLLPDSGVEPLVDVLLQAEQSGKTVVFAGSTVLAEGVAAALRARLGEHTVAQHTAGLSVEVQEQEVDRFCREPECAFLVADASAEEGRNFQFADRLVHLDLPLSTNRLEQRLGRLDRYGRGDPVPSLVVIPDEPPAWLSAWYGLLRDRLKVFDASVAALQFLMDELRPELTEALLRGDLTRLSATLSERVDQERSRLQRQDALDAIDLGAGFTLQDTMDALYDSETQPFSRVMQNWMLDALHFRSAKDGVCYRFSPSPEAPATLVPWERLRDGFRHLDDRTGTFSRAAALRTPGVHLYRLGEPTVDALHEYLNWDDRGQSYAMWRFDDAWKHHRDLLAFRFNYLIEGDLEVLTEAVRTAGWDEGALRRRLDALLPPRTHTVWLSHRGQLVPDEAIPILSRPFGKVNVSFPPEQLDYNLNWDRLWALKEFMTDSEWVETCRDVHGKADRAVQLDAELDAYVHRALSEAERRLSGTLEQLRTRAARLRTPEAQREVELEARLTPLLLQALRHPRIKLDSVGFTVLSGRDPFVDEVYRDTRR
ncbi:protein DpdE [Deinococcus knuensis]|uniref:ATP-dependent helicase HepA n=1 Tax=Deinococcus knuensis TaxID=1837380 RepID=A0ABQ2SRF4_9DEIO|nr:protein DpdE [Deinococcus knuensis]GGS37460.1 hypothetical protein GCM10008961_31290 [Deinococcus knuensis]